MTNSGRGLAVKFMYSIISMQIKTSYTIALFLLFGLNLCVQAHFPDKGQFNNYSFEYLGPDTIFVGEDCTAILDWGHPDNPIITPNMPGLAIVNTSISISGGFEQGDPVPADTDVTVTYTVNDNMGGVSTFSFTIHFADNSPPVFNLANIPEELTLSCGEEAELTDTQVSDNCTPFDELEITFTDSEPIDFCLNQTINRVWTVTDEYGNSSTLEQTLIVEADTEEPVLVQPAQDITVDCSIEDVETTFQNWISTNGGAVVTDDCPVIDWVVTPSTIDFTQACNDPKVFTFTATDPCGNSVESSASFTFSDNDDPVVITPPASLIFSCDGTALVDVFNNWLDSRAGMEVVDNCVQESSLTFSFRIDGQEMDTAMSEQLLLDAIFEDCMDGVEIDGTLYDGVTILLEVEFIFNDFCGNTVSDFAFFAVLDDEPPVITQQASDLIIDCTDQASIESAFLDWLDSAGGAEGTDDCGIVAFTTKDTPQELLSTLQTIQMESCGRTGSIDVTFQIFDGCLSTPGDSTTATFAIVDNNAPVLIEEPQSVTLECSPDLDEVLQQLIENYLGAEFEDECSEVTWTLFSWTDSNGASGTTTFGDYANYPFPTSEDCAWSVDIVFTVEDDCGNTSEAQGSILVEDVTAPTFISPPVDITVSCESVPDPEQPEVEDNCLFNLSVALEESSSQGDDPGFCSFYNYEITRTWTATDACGNVASVQQVVSVVDNQGPVISLPGFINVTCGDNIDPDLGQIINQISENCSPVDTLTFTDVEILGPCVGDFRIERRWTATDICGNSSTAIQQFIFTDNEPPTVEGEIEDLIISCEDIGNLNMEVSNWINAAADIDATDNCSDVLFFAAMPGSYDINDLATFPGSPVQVVEEGSCGGDFFIDEVVDFVYYDDCGNATVIQRSYKVIDDNPPTIQYCLEEVVFENIPQSCEGIVLLNGPIVTQGCTGTGTSASSNQTLEVMSNDPGNQDVIVNPLSFDIAIDLDGFQSIIGPVTVVVALENVDADEPTAFFNVLNEDGGFIGQTQPVDGPCGNGTTTFTIANIENVNRWASDGSVSFTLQPNTPANQPGRVSINDICQNSTVTVTLNYSLSEDENLVFEYRIDGGSRISYNPSDDIELTLPVGTYEVDYFVTDCFGNEASCNQLVSVLDVEPPIITCPDDIEFILEEEQCDLTIVMDLPLSFEDNCGFPDETGDRIPMEEMDALLTFTWNSTTENYIAEDVSFEFTGVQNINQQEVVQVLIHLQADVSDEDAYFTIIDEEGIVLGTTAQGQPNVTAGDCGLESVTTFEVSKSRYNRWARDGVIAFQAISNTDFDNPGNSSGITPCDPDAVNADGDNDGSSYIQMSILSGGFVPHFFITGATNLPLTTVDSSDVRPEVTFDIGQSFFHYVGFDKSGNADTCMIEVNVIDTFPPTAVCRNVIANVHPSGLIDYELMPEEVDGGSEDNCRIESMSVEPNVFDCSQVGEEVIVTLTVTDASGNTDACTSIVRIERFVLEPSFILDVCEPDTLRLFANLPDGPGPENYTFSWTGPNGYTSNQQNPIITNITSAFSGTYQLEVQGFGGCSAQGSVTVVVPEVLGVPDIQVASNPVCMGDMIQLETQAFSGNVTYNWYLGMPNTGELIASTPSPGLSLDFEAGVYDFYVQVETPFCLSPPSVVRQVTVLTQIEAVVDPDFIEICEAEVLQLSTPITGSGITYNWTGPANFSSSERNPLVSTSAELNNSGLYTLQLFQFGCPSTIATVEAEVRPRPPMPVIVSNNVSCPGEQLILSVNNVANANQYQWTHPDGSLIFTDVNVLTIPNAQESLNGGWTVFALDGGCRSAQSEPLIVDIEQLYDFTASNFGPVCEGDSVTLLVNEIPGATYDWSGPVQDIEPVFNPRILPLPGIYTASATTERGCNYESQTMVVVNIRPSITALSTDAEECVDGTGEVCLQATVFPSDDGSYSYEWEGNGFSSIEQVPCIQNVTSANNGIYTLMVTNDFGCPSEVREIELFVKDIPGQPILIAEDFYCEGGTFTIIVSNTIEDMVFEWFTPAGSIITDAPEFTIPMAEMVDEGEYSVQVTLDGCISPQSEPFVLDLRPKPDRPTAGGMSFVCEGDSLFLTSSFSPGSTYEWSGPNDFSSDEINPVIFPVMLEDQGDYRLRIDTDGCFSEFSAPFFVTVNPKPDVPRLETEDNILCASQDDFSLDICVAEEDVLTGSRYSWFEAVSDEQIGGPSTSRCFNINDLDRLEDGLNSFYVIVSLDGCTSDRSIPLEVRIDKLPELVAQTSGEVVACNQDEVLVMAEEPTQGSGQWTAIDNFLNIEFENDPMTSVFGLRPGENRVIWSLNYRSCIAYDSDTLLILYQELPEANDDFAVVPFAGQVRINILQNDLLPFAYTIDIVSDPMHGRLVGVDGESFDFVADPNYVGQDSFVYQICAIGCPGLCDEALVVVQIGDESICDIPNIITPNDDGINDVFFIPCLSSNLYPNNKVTIYNEWGAAIFEESPYSNSWEGLYRGQPVPVGTYFYVVEFGPDRPPEKGFLIVKR